DLVLVGAERRLPRRERRAVEGGLRPCRLHEAARRREPRDVGRARRRHRRLVRLAEGLDAAVGAGVLRHLELAVLDGVARAEEALGLRVVEEERAREEEG